MKAQKAVVMCLLLAGVVCGQEEKPLVLVAQSIPYARIVVADMPDHMGISEQVWRLDRTRTVRHAAEILQDYIQRSTGVRVPIVNASAVSAGRPLILVGRSSLTDFVEKERSKLAPEGYLVRREGRRIAIVGEVAGADALSEYRGADRGTLFGVYAFLEQTLGIRWYFPHELGIVVPKRPNLIVSALKLTEAPAFPMRTGAVYDDPDEGEAGLSLPVVRHGNTTGFHANHTCYHWYKFAESHPQVFAIGQDGKPMINADGPGGNKWNHLCYSEPDTLALEMEQIRSFHEQGVQYTELSLLPNDRYIRCVPKDIENIYHCNCERCKAQWREDPPDSKLSEVIFGYMARLAGEIDEEYPGKRLATLGYCGFLRPPRSVEVPDNLDVMLCTVMGNMKLVSPGHWQETTGVIEEWYTALGEDASRLFVFEYLVYPSSDAPMLYPHKLQEWVRFMRGKTSGGFSNGSRPRAGTARHRFALVNGWFWHKLLWNPDADVDALLAGWYRDLFGPAREPMAELFNSAISAWEGAPWGNSVNPGAVSHVHDRFMYEHVYSAELVSKMEALLKQARDAAAGDEEALRRVNYFGEAFEEFFGKAHEFQAAVGPAPSLTIPLLRESPVIDGEGGEAAWEGASAVDLRERRLGGDPVLATRIRLGYRDQVLYVAATCATGGDPVQAESRAHDDEAILGDDCIIVDLAFASEKVLLLPMFYRIAVNAMGAFADGTQIVPLVYEGLHHTRWSPYWTPVDLQAAVSSTEDGWQAEVAIPLSTIPEYTPSSSFRLQVRRQVPKPRLQLAWSPELVESYEVDLQRFGRIALAAE